jgi:alpha-beta hydrolase superfamily lysophospholipase
MISLTFFSNHTAWCIIVHPGKFQEPTMVRRDLLAAAAGAALAAGLGRPPAAAQQVAEGVARGSTRVAGFASGELDFQLMRSLGAANYGGGAPGEIFAVRTEIPGDDPYAWPPAMAAMAERVLRTGREARGRGHRISARDHFLRASMYFRAAEYFADPFKPEGLQWGLASRDAFISAAELMSDRIEAVQVPLEGKPLPGYFMRPAAGAERGKTIVILTGFDGTGEELYFEAAAAALARRYNVLVAEGPGQVGCMRLHPELKFRPDYEKPIGAMLDVALARPEVAAERLALYGISFGGYFVTRAGEHDPRIKALIVNSPIIDLYAYMAAFIGPMANNPPPLTLAEVDAVPDSEFPRTGKLSFKSACRRFGVDSLAGWLARLKDFNAEADLAAIRCPTLPMVGAGEGTEALAQFERYAAKVSGRVTKRIFTAAEGADMHCQLGNLPLSCAVVFDWLDETFAG